MGERAWISALAIAALACDRPATTTTVAAPATRPAVEPPAPVAAEPPPSAPIRSLPVVRGDQALVLADTPAATVAIRFEAGDGGQLNDGEIVELLPAAGTRLADGERRVSVGGKPARIQARHLVDELEIVRSPDGEFAIVSPEIDCGDVCHHVAWLVRRMSERRKLVDDVVELRVAWHPQGSAVALDLDQSLMVLALPSGETLATSDELCSPRYSPRGELFVRGVEDWGVYTFADGKGVRVGKGARPRDEDELDDGPPPVRFAPDGTWRLPE